MSDLSAEEKLTAIAAIYDTLTRDAEGFISSTHARLNLEGALIDIRHNDGVADSVCIRTILRVLHQLAGIEQFIPRSPVVDTIVTPSILNFEDEAK